MRSKQKANKELVIKFITGESTEAEGLLVNQWLNENEENKKFFDEVKFLWKASGITQNLSDDDKNNDWDIILDKIGETTKYQLLKSKDRLPETTKVWGGKTKNAYLSFLRIAAIFILAFGLSYTLIHFGSKTSFEESLAYNTLITTRGQKSQLILSDGTKIWLNSESTLKYPSVFDKKKREVILTGEAYFEVKKGDDYEPFIVNTSDISIEVTGTSFNVMAYPFEDVIETTLVEGSVTLYREDKELTRMQPVYLKPNQKATLIKKGSQIALSKIAVDKPTLTIGDKTIQNKAFEEIEQVIIIPKVFIEPHTAWKDDQLIFKSESLENICYKLERWFDVEIKIADDEQKEYCYTGKFTNKESLSQVLEIIGMTTPIKYTYDKNLIIIDGVNN
ncbi:MAG: FecR family protein [Bacteroidota bacterium]